MQKLLLIITLTVSGFVSQAQTKEAARPPFKKEKIEMKQADRERLQLEKDQLTGKPEIIGVEKLGQKQRNKKQLCKNKKYKRS